MIDVCPIIHHSLRPIWKTSIDLYFEQKYHCFSFCLLLPLFEASLRYLYCLLNKFSNRLLTAISSEYYVTFSNIFAFDITYEDISNSVINSNRIENNLYKYFPKSLMFIMGDFLQLPDGLRFRDRLSHGQIDFNKINKTVTNHLFCSIMSMLIFVVKTSSVNDFQLEAKINRLYEHLIQIEHYRTQYHPIHRLQTNIICLIQKVIQLTEFDEDLTNLEQLELFQKNFNNFYIDISQHWCDTNQIQSTTLLFTNCISNLHCFIENIINFKKIRSEQLSRCQLRSRQRDNYQTFLVQHSSTIINVICDEIIWKIFYFWLKQYKTIVFYQIQLKQMLKYAENLNQKSRLKENNWHFVCLLLDQLIDLFKQIDLKIKE